MSAQAIGGLLRVALRAFLWSAGLFGLYTLIAELQRALEPELAAAAWDSARRAALSFGIGMAVLFVLLSLPEWLRSRQSGGLRTRYTERLVLALPRDDAMALCRVALRESAGVRRVRDDGDRLLARARATWLSWGERLSIEITDVDDERTHVRIASEPLWGGTIFDYGQGGKRVATLRERLTRTDRSGPGTDAPDSPSGAGDAKIGVSSNR